ncbi:MAG: fibronectin type III domain-containing protein [candidate division KSB1 bacterium]|nr:fibronectin type III domain-containing protein [candidate division KSB1 bacterium]
MKFFTAIFCSLAIFGGGLVSAAEQIGLYTDKKIIPPDYDSFHPPLSVGSTYSDPVFGTRVTRMTNSSRFNDEVVGGYFSNAEICYFNKDGFYFLAIENEWDGDNYPLTTFLYNGLTGERIKLLGRDHIRPYQIRWALAKQYTVNGVTVTMDPNYHFYNYVGNEIRLYDVRSMNDYVVLRKFDEYSEIGPSGGEGDLSDDGRYWVLDGDAKEMFVYDLIKDVKHPVSTFDLGSLGSKSGSVGVDYATISARGDYIIVAWGTDPGIGRYRGIEVYDKNWNFQRQIYPGIIHWETGVDAYGEQVVYCAGTTSYPEFDALDGISTGDFISIRLRDGYVRLLKDVPIWSHYSMSACNSVNGGDYLYVSLTSTRTDDPYELWAPFWGEILEIPTDGSGQVRRLLHHRSRPVQGRTGKFATPDAVINRQGNRIVFRSTYNTSYGDLFMFEIPARQQSSDPDDIPPLKPDDLQGYQDNSNTIRLEWTTPDAARDGDQPRFYKLYRNGSYITDVFNTEFFDAGLDAGTFYRYNVYSVDNAGNLSEQPATVSLTTPADFSVSRIRDVEIAGRHSVQIKFSQPLSRLTAETVSNYSLYPSGSVNSAVLDADEKTVILNVSELQTGMSYYVTVRNLTDQSVTPVPLIRVDSPRFVILKDWFDDFESSTFSSYQFLNPDRWNIIPQGKDRALVLESTSFDSPGGKRLGEYMIIPHSIFYSTRFYLRCHVSSLEDLLSNAHADYAVVFAYEDAFNYWYVQVHTYNVAVNHIENGERVLFQEYPLTVNLDQEHRFDLAFYNGELKAAVNKKLCFSLSLSLPAGQLGLGSYNDAVAFDNLNLQADRPLDFTPPSSPRGIHAEATVKRTVVYYA